MTNTFISWQVFIFLFICCAVSNPVLATSKDSVELKAKGVIDQSKFTWMRPKNTKQPAGSGENNGAFTYCRPEWFPFGGKCYKLTVDTLNWEDASKRCSLNDGQLATIDSQGLNDFLFTYILITKEAQEWTKHIDRVWIGLHKTGKSFIWDDGSALRYTNWDSAPFLSNHGNLLPAEGSDSERNYTQTEKKNCVHLLSESYKLSRGTWKEEDCNLHLPSICQIAEDKNIRPSPDPRFCTPENGGGWMFGDSCYNIIREKKNWTEAEEFCFKKYKGHLVTIPDYKTSYLLDYILKNNSEVIWIGLKIHDGLTQTWSSGSQISYNNWVSRYLDVGSCVLRLDDGKWVNVTCDAQLKFVCEVTNVHPVLKPPTVEGSYCPVEPAGWTDLGGDFCYHIEMDNIESWPIANFNCFRLGGDLVSIHSEEEQMVLNQFIDRIGRVSGVFIGFARDRQQKFVWADHSPVDYVAWDRNNPGSEADTFVEMDVSGAKIKNWRDVSCNEKKGYICSMQKYRPIITTESEMELTTSRLPFEANITTVAPPVGTTHITTTFVPEGQVPGGKCPYLRFSPEHTYCKPKNAACDIIKSGISYRDKKYIVKLHNDYRNKLATGKETEAGGMPPAANMLEMFWDDELAAIAQKHTEGCVYRHDCNDCRKVARFQVGQNVAQTGYWGKVPKETDWKNIVNSLFIHEVSVFDKKKIKPYVPGPMDPNTQYGHYTQVAWANTYRIGCGSIVYREEPWTKTFLACNYGPAGNIIGGEMYKAGPACSACPKNTCCSTSCQGKGFKLIYPGLCKIVNDKLTPEGYQL